MTNADRQLEMLKKKRENAFKNKKEIKIIPSKEYRNYNTHHYRNIKVIIEDDGYALQYVKNLLETVFKDLYITIWGAHGAGSLHHLIARSDDDCIILIYDGLNTLDNIKNIKNEILNFNKRNPKSRIVKITPKCFEEIMLSCTDLPYLNQPISDKAQKVIDLIQDYATGKIDDYTVCNFILNKGRFNDDMILEDWMENITNGKRYECLHEPSVISDCWFNDCDICNKKTQSCNVIHTTSTELYNPSSKLEYMALRSLSYFIIKAIDDYLQHTFRLAFKNTKIKLADIGAFMEYFE